jgi:hypothetical protein
VVGGAHPKGESTARGVWSPASVVFTGVGQRGGDLRWEENEGKGEMRRRGPEESSQWHLPEKATSATRAHGLPT